MIFHEMPCGRNILLFSRSRVPCALGTLVFVKLSRVAVCFVLRCRRGVHFRVA